MLDVNVQHFKKAFTDFDENLDIYLIHSLGRMNGGTRELGGKIWLIFGADLMARLHSWADDSAFFQHELFHIHHARHFDECEQVWCALWSEGLATHVAATLVPDAGHAELLLTIPATFVPDTQTRMREALQALRENLRSSDDAVKSNLFQFGSGNFPPRHGYYLGWVVARRVAGEVTLSELAQWDNETVYPRLEGAIDAMIVELPD
jgi:hypothetical protein